MLGRNLFVDGVQCGGNEQVHIECQQRLIGDVGSAGVPDNPSGLAFVLFDSRRVESVEVVNGARGAGDGDDIGPVVGESRRGDGVGRETTAGDMPTALPPTGMQIAARLRREAVQTNQRRVLVLAGEPSRTRECAGDALEAGGIDLAATTYLGPGRPLDCETLGITFSGYHWYAVGEETLTVLEDAAPYLVTANVCGSSRVDGSGPAATIEPLGAGELDNFALLGALAYAGYDGPIGIQGYSVGGDPYARLSRSFEALRSLEARLRAHPEWAAIDADRTI